MPIEIELQTLLLSKIDLSETIFIYCNFFFRSPPWSIPTLFCEDPFIFAIVSPVTLLPLRLVET